MQEEGLERARGDRSGACPSPLRLVTAPKEAHGHPAGTRAQLHRPQSGGSRFGFHHLQPTSCAQLSPLPQLGSTLGVPSPQLSSCSRGTLEDAQMGARAREKQGWGSCLCFPPRGGQGHIPRGPRSGEEAPGCRGRGSSTSTPPRPRQLRGGRAFAWTGADGRPNTRLGRGDGGRNAKIPGLGGPAP